MNVQLKSLSLINFKGIRNLTVKFNHLTSIYGANGLGKTTIFDAFIWLLFGKDSTGSATFNIKTLDSNNTPIEKIDHEVIGILDVNGTETTLRRVYKEKWTKKRGSEQTEFTGHETLYFINEAPYQSGEYQKEINAIIDENLFRLITSPHYFNSLKWEKRREVLTKIAGEVSDAEIADLKPSFQQLLSMLSTKPMEKFKAEISAKKKYIKESLEFIPTRISEVQRGMVAEPNYATIENHITSYLNEVEKLDLQIADKSRIPQDQLDAVLEDQKEINKLKGELQQLTFDAQQESQRLANERQSKINGCQNKVDSLSKDFDFLNERIKTLESEIKTNAERKDSLLKEWHAENEKTIEFKDNEFICPTCNRAYETDDIESRKAEMVAHFNADKLAKLGNITKQGQGYASFIKKYEEELGIKQAKRNEVYRSLESAKIELEEAKKVNSGGEISSPIPGYAERQAKITALENKPKPQPQDTTELKTQKSNIQKEIDSLKEQLLIKGLMEKARTRIAELTNEEKSLAQQLADLEKQEFTILDFEKAKIDMVEERVNKMFSYVQFKMFNRLINGGVEPCCECMINGVPWADANNAARVNGGLDIVRTLCKFYGVTAPVFSDNAESVNEFLPLDSQLIKLVVTLDQQLKVA